MQTILPDPHKYVLIIQYKSDLTVTHASLILKRKKGRQLSSVNDIIGKYLELSALVTCLLVYVYHF